LPPAPRMCAVHGGMEQDMWGVNRILSARRSPTPDWDSAPLTSSGEQVVPVLKVIYAWNLGGWSLRKYMAYILDGGAPIPFRVRVLERGEPRPVVNARVECPREDLWFFAEHGWS